MLQILPFSGDFPPQLGHFFIGIQKKSHEVTTLQVCNFFEPCRVGGCVDVHRAWSQSCTRIPLFFHMNRGMRSIAIGREKGRGGETKRMGWERRGGQEWCCLSKANEWKRYPCLLRGWDWCICSAWFYHSSFLFSPLFLVLLPLHTIWVWHGFSKLAVWSRIFFACAFFFSLASGAKIQLKKLFIV